jgi:hypothetical protein
MFKLNVGVVLGIVLFAAPAWSSIITVSNFSFESPLLVSGAPNVVTDRGLYEFGNLMSGGDIPGWHTTTGASTAGIFAPNSTQTLYTPDVVSPVATGATGVPNGFQVLFLQPGGSIYQNLTPIAGDGHYQVTVDVGHRSDVLSGAYSIILSSGITELARFDGNISSIARGAWAQETFTYNGAATPSSLKLTLTAAADNQVAFDNVQVDAAPEIGGSSVFWTMIGVAGFWIYRRKRLVA